MSDKFSGYPQYDNDTTIDCDACEARIRTTTIDECIEKIDTLETISFGSIIKDCIKSMLEELKGQKNNDYPTISSPISFGNQLRIQEEQEKEQSNRAKRKRHERFEGQIEEQENE